MSESRCGAASAPGRRALRPVLDLGLLYASKVGALLVGLFFLPAYNHLLGPAAFGVAMVLVSVQSLLLILDLGASTLVGRDIAAQGDNDAATWPTLRAGLGVVTAEFAVLTLIAVLCSTWLPLPMGTGEVVACALGCWALTTQNVGQAALLSRRLSKDAALLQFCGALLRAAGTLAALHGFGATLATFVWAQAAFAILHCVATIGRCHGLMRWRPDAGVAGSSTVPRMKAMLDRGRPLMLSSVAGAMVMHLDKAIVTTFYSPVAAGPYFLATSLCLAPLTALAAPVSQYFQPRLIRSISQDQPDMPRALMRFAIVLAIVTLLPSAIVWVWRDAVVSAWLSPGSTASAVVMYVAVLLPGICIGALGYVPYAMLLARQDYKFQSRTSTLLTATTLTAQCAFAAHGSVLGVCASLATYHAVSTAVLWLRCLRLFNCRTRSAVRRAAARTLAAVLATSTFTTAMTALRAAW